MVSLFLICERRGDEERRKEKRGQKKVGGKGKGRED
jgi:hypothetical protein